MRNSTNATPTPIADSSDAPKLTPMGRELLRAMGLYRFSFFDGGIVEGEGIWHSNLTDEAAGMEKLPKTPTGVANVIDKLDADGYVVVGDLDEGDKWVGLTALGVETIDALVAEHIDADSDDAPTGGPTGTTVAPVVVEGTGELAGGDVQPLAKSTRGRNGTTKSGKTVTKKTGNPKTDAAVNAPKTSSKTSSTKSAASKTSASKKTTAKKTAAAPAAKRVPGKFSTKGQHVITNRRSRFSGTIVQLVNVNGEGSNMQPDKRGFTYAKKCVDHNFALYAPTRKEAWDGASDPTQWCPKCKSAASKATPKPVTKKTAAAAKKTSSAPAPKTSSAKKSATTKTAAAKTTKSAKSSK